MPLKEKHVKKGKEREEGRGKLTGKWKEKRKKICSNGSEENYRQQQGA
jgi:hypothetical protein